MHDIFAKLTSINRKKWQCRAHTSFPEAVVPVWQKRLEIGASLTERVTLVKSYNV